MLAFHITGMLAAAFHFGNGLAALAGPWGLALDERAQRRAAQVGLWATIVLGLVGVHALLAFVHPAFRWLAPAGTR
jgi:succinate dehydrogenase / fumarate reductase cytochrome b subunit